MIPSQLCLLWPLPESFGFLLSAARGRQKHKVREQKGNEAGVFVSQTPSLLCFQQLAFSLLYWKPQFLSRGLLWFPITMPFACCIKSTGIAAPWNWDPWDYVGLPKPCSYLLKVVFVLNFLSMPSVSYRDPNWKTCLFITLFILHFIAVIFVLFAITSPKLRTLPSTWYILNTYLLLV